MARRDSRQDDDQPAHRIDRVYPTPIEPPVPRLARKPAASSELRIQSREDELQKQLAAKDDELTSQIEERLVLLATVAKLEARNRQLETETEELRAQNTSLVTELEVREMDLVNRRDAEIERTTLHADEHAAELDALRTQFELDLATANGELGAANVEIKALREQLAMAETDRAGMIAYLEEGIKRLR